MTADGPKVHLLSTRQAQVIDHTGPALVYEVQSIVHIELRKLELRTIYGMSTGLFADEPRGVEDEVQLVSA